MFTDFNLESMFRDFMSDPVLWMSFGILALTLGLMIFYTWYFIKNVIDAEIPIEELKQAETKNNGLDHKNGLNLNSHAH